MSRDSVQGGHCVDDNICVFEKTECSTDIVYRSSSQLQSTPNAHGGSCLWQSAVLGKSLGKCTDGTCSPNVETCATKGSGFSIESESCSVKGTTFGSCGSRCSWSPDSCAIGESWTFPSKDCQCEQVQVGGCYENNQLFCAVSSLGCADESAWLDPLEVVTTTGKTCFLCREQAKPIVTGIVSSKSSRTPLIVGSVVGSIVGISAVSFLGIVYLRRYRNRKSAAAGDKVNPPQITIPSFNSEQDNVSVLE